MRWLTFALAAACIYLALRPRSQEQEQGGALDLGAFELDAMPDPLPFLDWETIVQKASSAVRNVTGAWRPPAQYADAIRQAEDANGIPRDVLARLLYQESRYREDIITGRVRSPVGAVGISQAMPATSKEWAFDPLDPFASIDFAGRYLAWLYRRHGNWSEALAAYNWGTGNVARKGLARAPTETRNYYSQILGDVNSANGTSWA